MAAIRGPAPLGLMKPECAAALVELRGTLVQLGVSLSKPKPSGACGGFELCLLGVEPGFPAVQFTLPTLEPPSELRRLKLNLLKEFVFMPNVVGFGVGDG